MPPAKPSFIRADDLNLTFSSETGEIIPLLWEGLMRIKDNITKMRSLINNGCQS